MAIAARQMKTTATTNLDYRRTRFVKKNCALQVLLLSMCAPFLTLWSGAQSTQDAAMSSATAGSSSASPTEQQEMRDELRALRAEVELLRAAVEQQRHTTLANDHGELVPEATTGAGPNVRSLRASVAEGVGKAEPVAAASSPPQGTGGLQGWLAQNPSTSSDAASAEAGEASTWDEFPRRVPYRKIQGKNQCI
jgi:hypothetical protein